MLITFAFCTYRRANRLEGLVQAMRAQACPVPFELLAVNNNSPDDTSRILARLAEQPGPPLRWVTETNQGIVPARNRAIEEAINSDILVFIDDDELPHPGLLNAVYGAIVNEGAQCAGGRVEVDFTPYGRPAWLEDNLLGFLAEVKHGDSPFWIINGDTPIWTANVAYDMRLFRDDPSLRFDNRYNRKGAVVGGGEDVIMFRALLARGAKIRYRPDMIVSHFIEPIRLKRRYFINVHYHAGIRYGRYHQDEYPRKLFGIPPFLIAQFLRQCKNTAAMSLKRNPGVLRQAMNAAHALGTIVGYAKRNNRGRT